MIDVFERALRARNPGMKLLQSPAEAVRKLRQQLTEVTGPSRFDLHDAWIFLSSTGYRLTRTNEEWDDGTGGVRIRCPPGLSVSTLIRAIEQPTHHDALVRALGLMRSPFFSHDIRLDAADAVSAVVIAALRDEADLVAARGEHVRNATKQ